MKKILSCCAFMIFSLLAYCQNVGIGTTAPDNSAQLDVVSTNRGLLMPRMNNSQIAAIISPAKGLMVFNTDSNSFWFYNGIEWVNISTVLNTWSLNGNAGTNPNQNFIGTTDNQPLSIKVGNTRMGFLDLNGNVFWGDESGFSNTVGSDNVAIGVGALHSNTDGNSLVAIGANALFNNKGSTTNTAIGSSSLFTNTTGESNAATGYQALYFNTIGCCNTANGYQTLFKNTSGYFNTALGYTSLWNNITGIFNSAVGFQSLYSNTLGNYNTANGNEALYYNKTGAYNTASGYNSLLKNIDGSNNVAVGNGALYNNTGGSFLVAIGDSALFYSTALSGNTAVGSHSLFNTTAGNNTAIGTRAGITVIDGVGNTLVGANADVYKPQINNGTAIGYLAIVNSSDKVRIGNTKVKVIEGEVAFSSSSDARFKYNIKKNVPGLDFIKRLIPVTYYFDDEKMDHFTRTGELSNPMVHSTSSKEIKQLRTGFLAQDVEKAAGESGFDFDGIHKPMNDKDHYSLAYGLFVVPLVKAVQEQQIMIEQQQKLIDNLRKQAEKDKTQKIVQVQRQQIESLTQRIETIEKLLGNSQNKNK